MSTQKISTVRSEGPCLVASGLTVRALASSLSLGAITANAADTTPPNITCGKDKSAQCGTAWFFDIPTAKDEVDGNNVLIEVVATVTNVALPRCPQIFSVTRTWRATD